MVSFRVQKKLGPRPDRSPLGGLIQNFRRASPLFSYAKCPPPLSSSEGRLGAKCMIFNVRLCFVAGCLLLFSSKQCMTGLVTSTLVIPDNKIA